MVWRFGDYGVMVLVFKRREYLRQKDKTRCGGSVDVVVVIGPEFGKLKQWLRRTGIYFWHSEMRDWHGLVSMEYRARTGEDHA